MTSDDIDELRTESTLAVAKNMRLGHYGLQAAAEIERLKNELKREQIEGEESDRQIQHLLSDNERLRNDHIAAHRISVATIDFLEGRLERLRAALKPFADMACELSARNWKDDRVVVALDNRDDPHRIVAKDFFDARQVLNQQQTVGDLPTRHDYPR